MNCFTVIIMGSFGTLANVMKLALIQMSHGMAPIGSQVGPMVS